MRKIISNFKTKFYSELDTATKNVVDYFKPLINDIKGNYRYSKPMISGGAIVSKFLDLPIKDIDLYGRCHSYSNKTYNNINIDFVKSDYFRDPEDIIARHDFTIVKFVINHNLSVYYHEDFYNDLEKRLLKIDYSTFRYTGLINQNKEKYKKRIEKYISKGFTIDQHTLNQLDAIIDLRNMNQKYVESIFFREFNDLLGHNFEYLKEHEVYSYSELSNIIKVYRCDKCSSLAIPKMTKDGVITYENPLNDNVFTTSRCEEIIIKDILE